MQKTQEHITNLNEVDNAEHLLQDIILRINLALDEVRPYLLEDKGDIEFIKYETDNKVAVLRFLGNCVNCPMAIMTLRAGIERYILYYAPEVRRVEAIK